MKKKYQQPLSFSLCKHIIHITEAFGSMQLKQLSTQAEADKKKRPVAKKSTVNVSPTAATQGKWEAPWLKYQRKASDCMIVKPPMSQPQQPAASSALVSALTSPPVVQPDVKKNRGNVTREGVGRGIHPCHSHNSRQRHRLWFRLSRPHQLYSQMSRKIEVW